MVEPSDIEEAYRRLQPRVHRTPVMRCTTLDRALGAELFFKCENFQRTGAFKFRGAMNAVLCLDRSRAVAGVVTHSSGNHGAAVALAARERGIPAHVVLPRGAAGPKRAAVVAYGARVVQCEPTVAARQATAEAIAAETGAALIHPYDDPQVIAGQGTVALELLGQVPDLDVVIAPVGGGGLLSGISLAVAARAARIVLLGAEPAIADDARRSLLQGRRLPSDDAPTIADGLRAGLGALTFPILQRHLETIVTAGEEGIVEAMRLLWERMKLVVEPSAAVPLAGLLAHPEVVRGRRVGVVLSGGNVDLGHLPWETVSGAEAGLGGARGRHRARRP